MTRERFEIESNGMARCGICGEPVAHVLVGDVAAIERDPLIVIRCYGCAATEEAEAITKASA